jgi:hypothetical protein
MVLTSSLQLALKHSCLLECLSRSIFYPLVVIEELASPAILDEQLARPTLVKAVAPSEETHFYCLSNRLFFS